MIKANQNRSLIFLLSNNHIFLGLYYFDYEAGFFKRIFSHKKDTCVFFDIFEVKEALTYCCYTQKFETKGDFNPMKGFSKDISAVIIN